MHPDTTPHPFADVCPPGDGLPTEEFTEEQVAGMYAAFLGLADAEGLPSPGSVAAAFKAANEPDPFLGE
jgi:hypothetical protein